VTSREQILAANEETFRAWNAHDPDAVAAVFSPDAEIVDVTAHENIRGRDAIRRRASDLLEAFPDFHLEQRMLLVDGTANADRWVMTGTHEGIYYGLAPTGRRVEVDGATFSEFDDAGLVVRDTHYIDVNALLQQLQGD
jgi:steroid delta-isomerase-like uncharacterized protein